MGTRFTSGNIVKPSGDDMTTPELVEWLAHCTSQLIRGQNSLFKLLRKKEVNFVLHNFYTSAMRTGYGKIIILRRAQYDKQVQHDQYCHPELVEG